ITRQSSVIRLLSAGSCVEGSLIQDDILFSNDFQHKCFEIKLVSILVEEQFSFGEALHFGDIRPSCLPFFYYVSLLLLREMTTRERRVKVRRNRVGDPLSY